MKVGNRESRIQERLEETVGPTIDNRYVVLRLREVSWMPPQLVLDWTQDGRTEIAFDLSGVSTGTQTDATVQRRRSTAP